MAVSSRRQFSAEKGICHMRENTITQLPDPSGFSSDPFTDVLRDGARKLIEQAIQAELAALMNAFSGERLEDGRARLLLVWERIPEGPLRYCTLHATLVT